MRAAFASQWIKLMRPAVVLGTLLASVAFAALATVVSVTGAHNGPQPGSPTAAGRIDKVSLGHADGVVYSLSQATQFLGIVALVLFAYVLAGEYSLGTLRNALIRQPRRLVLLAGSYAALASLVMLAALAATTVAVAVALLLAPSSGIDTSAWTSSAGVGEMLRAAADTSVAMIGFGTLGAALALWLRSSVAAIGIGVAYLLPVETILRAAFNGADGWLPGTALSALAAGGNDAVGYPRALIIGLGYILIAAVLGGRMFHRRDVV